MIHCLAAFLFPLTISWRSSISTRVGLFQLYNGKVFYHENANLFNQFYIYVIYCFVVYFVVANSTSMNVLVHIFWKTCASYLQYFWVKNIFFLILRDFATVSSRNTVLTHLHPPGIITPLVFTNLQDTKDLKVFSLRIL